MALRQALRTLVYGRLSIVAEEILWTLGRILTEYENEAFHLKQEMDHKLSLHDMAVKQGLNLHRAGWLN